MTAINVGRNSYNNQVKIHTYKKTKYQNIDSSKKNIRISTISFKKEEELIYSKKSISQLIWLRNQ